MAKGRGEKDGSEESTNVYLAREMNKVMGLEPPIDDTLEEKELVALIKDNAEAPNDEGIRADDPFTAQAKAQFVKLGIKVPKEWAEEGTAAEAETGNSEPDDGSEENNNKGEESMTKDTKATKKAKADVPASCYGHRGGCKGAVMDEAFAKGGTLEAIAKKAKRDVNAIKIHLNHLVKMHGLKYDETAKGKITVTKFKTAHIK